MTTSSLDLLEAGAGLPDCEVRTFADLSGDRGGAIFSKCGTYRYLLWRFWGRGLTSCAWPMVGWVMLNPSTADERLLDPTLTRCRVRSMAVSGVFGMVVANLFALRSTDPKALQRHIDPVGRENLSAIETLARIASPVICGWGSHGSLEGRGRGVSRLLAAHGADLRCLGTTKEGHPRHPLYVPYAAGCRPLEAPAPVGTEG